MVLFDLIIILYLRVILNITYVIISILNVIFSAFNRVCYNKVVDVLYSICTCDNSVHPILFRVAVRKKIFF